MALRFEWRRHKASANLKKHGISFQGATVGVWRSFLATISDPDCSGSEARFVDLGVSYRGRLLVLSYESAATAPESSAPGGQPALNNTSMKASPSKRKAHLNDDTMRPEYDFSKGIRGKHAARYASGTNVVVLDPDVAAEFRTAEEVNETLRAVAEIVRRRKKPSRRKTA